MRTEKENKESATGLFISGIHSMEAVLLISESAVIEKLPLMNPHFNSVMYLSSFPCKLYLYCTF